MEFSKSIKNENQTRRFSIATTDAGWEVREEHNGKIVKRVQCQDWHRVERARRSIATELEALQRQGWFEDVTLQ